MEVFERIAGIVLPVLIIIAVGYGYARLRGDGVRTDVASVNRITMDLLAPLLIFTSLAAQDFDISHHAVLMFAGVMICLGSGLLAWGFARLVGYDPRSFVPTMMYSNSGNMGLPLAVFAFGATGLSPAVALFVAGSFVYFSLGIRIVASGHGGKSPSILRMMMNPMMLAMVIGIVAAMVQIKIPRPLYTALRMVGEASIPIMLFALGVRMRDVSFASWRTGLVGAVMCPITGFIVAFLLDMVLTLTPDQRAQMYLFASLPPAVYCFMIAEQYKQEPDKVAAMVFMGNIAALAFVPLGLWIGLYA